MMRWDNQCRAAVLKTERFGYHIIFGLSFYNVHGNWRLIRFCDFNKTR